MRDLLVCGGYMVDFFNVLGGFSLFALPLSLIGLLFKRFRAFFQYAAAASTAAFVSSLIITFATDPPHTYPASSSPRIDAAKEAATPPRAKGEMIIQGDAKFGCVDRDRFETLGRLIVEGDQSAFKSQMLSALLQDQCVPFKDGETVYLEDTVLFSGLIKVRRKSEGTEYWTTIEAAK